MPPQYCLRPDAKTLEIIQALIPIVKPLREQNPDFPEAFCDATSALIADVKAPDLIKEGIFVKAVCGSVKNEGKNNQHIWVKVSDLNIDFTAHQFKSLIPHIPKVNGFDVLFGSDEYFESLGYEVYPKEQCSQQLMNAAFSIFSGEFGELDLDDY